jgi:exodeoxyribonuclease VII large subunit
LGPVLGVQLGSRRAALERSAASLAALGPQATLDRGYAIVRRRSDSAIVRDPAQAAPGEPLTVRVAHGEIAATVDADDGGPTPRRGRG